MSEDVKAPARPDAVLLPKEWRPSGDAVDRGHGTLDHAERLLGTNRRAGEQAYVRIGDGSHYFCTGDPYDTLYFPKRHARSGKPRYHWEQQDDGSVHGFLVDDEARATAAELRRHAERGGAPLIPVAAFNQAGA